MNEEMNEKLSAMVDGEIDDQSDQIIDTLIQNPSMRNTWWRYHLISDVLSRELSGYTDSRLADEISAKIKDEPTVLSPQRNAAAAYVKPLAGLAIAASVAAMAILGVQQNRQELPEVSNPPQIIAQAPVVTPERQYTFPSRPASIQLPDGQNRTPVSDSRMNSYLLNYNEFRTNGTRMQGMIPYVRIIANDREQ